MKKSILIFAVFLWSFICAAISPTSFTFQFYDANGQPDTNYTTMQGWPPATNNPATNILAYVSAVNWVTNGSGYVTNVAAVVLTNTINYQHQ